MKISSASKKVLASALSAAMVVAFAPTVAFGATGDAVTVTIDADGGTATITSYPYAKEGTAITLGDAEKNGYKLSKWWYDANGNGKQDADGSELFNAGSEFTPSKSAVTLKAIYAVPTAAVAVNTDTTQVTTAAGNEVNPTATIAVTLDGGNAKADTDYTLTVTNPSGTVVRTVEYEAPEAKGSTADFSASAKVYFVGNALSTDDEQVADSRLVSGKYTVALSDGTSTVASEEVELVTVKTENKLDGADASTKTQKVYWLDGGKVQATLPVLSAGQCWLDADGYAVSDENVSEGCQVTVKGDATFTATDTAQYTTPASYDDSDRTLNFAVCDASGAEGDIYAVSVADPSGAVVYSAELDGADVASIVDLYFTFNQKDATCQHALNGATEKAGTYVVTVTKTAKADGAVTSSKSKGVLTEVKYDAGSGSFDPKGALADESAQDYFVDGLDVDAISALPAAAAVKAADGYEFSKWSLNGKEYAAAAANVALKAGEVNTVSAVYVAKANTKVAAPTVTSASYDSAKKQYTVKVATATAGAKLTYSIGGSDKGAVPADGIVCKAGETLKVKASVVPGATDPTLTEGSEVTVSFDQSAFASVVKGAKSDLETYIGKTKVKYLEEDSVKAAIATGQAALDAQVADVDANWVKLVTAQVKGVYDAVSAYADSSLAAYEGGALVVVGDKAYTLDAKTLAAQQEKVKAAADAVAKAEAAKTADIEGYANAIKTIVSETNTALEAAGESKEVTAADVTAAETVTEQLKAAADATAAKAAIEAYNALTDAQKKLVATADVTAAQKVVADQEKIDGQDQAAVNYCNSLKKKTVKVAKKTEKTAKKASVSWKKRVSKSGNAVTYAKVSGSAKITVSANGKATLKKGVKKGTYKAKVKVSCGNATRTVTAKFIVK